MRPPVEVRLQSQTVQIPEFAGRALDLANRDGIQHVALDAFGTAPRTTPIRWVRVDGGAWMSVAAPLSW
jgi:hypothetical protein